MTARASELLVAIAEMVPRFVALAEAAPADHRVAWPTRDIGELTDLLTTHAQRLLTTVAEFDDPAPLMHFDGDQQVPADLQPGTFLGELIVHGRDIAQAVGEDWPIDPAMVPLVYLGLHQVLPGWVDPEHPRRVDAHISAEPVTALLTSYGRVGQIGPAVTARSWSGVDGRGWRSLYATGSCPPEPADGSASTTPTCSR